MPDNELSLVLILLLILPVWMAAAPWPALLLVGAQAVAKGRAAGFVAAAGVFAGSALWVGLALSGLAPGLLGGLLPDVLRLAYALVLAGLAWAAGRGGAGGPPGPAWAWGAALHALNPGIALFWAFNATRVFGPEGAATGITPWVAAEGLAILAGFYAVTVLVAALPRPRAFFTRHERRLRFVFAALYTLTALLVLLIRYS